MEETNFLKIDELRRIKVAREILILDKAKKLSEEKNKHLKELKFYINVISSAARGKLKETAHSMILHDLLHHPFLLSSFLEEIVGISADTFTKDDIRYPDQERIDLSLVSKKNNAFLIIENKVNAAEERPGQIYRYLNLALEQGFSKVFVLYLNPDNEDPPSLYSRSKDGLGKETDKETVPVESIIIRNYKSDILRWLIELEKTFIETNEMFLKSALNQYIDYLKEYFEINDRYNVINKRMKEEIFKHLGLEENTSIEHQIDILKDYLRDIDSLQKEVSEILSKLETVRINQIYETGIKQLENEFKEKIELKRISNEPNEFRCYFKYRNHPLHVSFKYSGDKPYWSICSNPDDKPDDEMLIQMGTILGKMPLESAGNKDRKFEKNSSDHNWLLYNDPPIENWNLRIKDLICLLLRQYPEVQFQPKTK